MPKCLYALLLGLLTGWLASRALAPAVPIEPVPPDTVYIERPAPSIPPQQPTVVYRYQRDTVVVRDTVWLPASAPPPAPLVFYGGRFLGASRFQVRVWNWQDRRFDDMIYQKQTRPVFFEAGLQMTDQAALYLGVGLKWNRGTLVGGLLWNDRLRPYLGVRLTL